MRENVFGQTLDFMTHAARKLRLDCNTSNTAKLLFHRFFAVYTPAQFDSYLVGMTTLYLGSKIAETPRRLRDVIITCHRHLHSPGVPLSVGQEYWRLRDSVVRCEALLLRALGYDMACPLPTPYMLHYCLALVSAVPGAEGYMTRVARLAWAFLNDSFHTSMCVDYAAHVIAGGVLALALRCCTPEVKEVAPETQWWQALGLKESDLNEICNRMLLLYEADSVGLRAG